MSKTVALLVVALASVWGPVSGGEDQVVIDPDVRAVTRGGTRRVLVELRAGRDEAAISRVQDAVVRGLAGTGARVARRYATTPLLALEIDAAALARLETMPALVGRVRVDAIARPSERQAPR